MNYIKNYDIFIGENLKIHTDYKYSNDKYVILKNKDWLFLVHPCVKIIEFYATSEHGIIFDYEVEVIIKEYNSISGFYINENEILRNATQDESNEYELIKKSIEYNL